MADTPIRITAEVQTDPNQCKFVLDRLLAEEGTFFFDNPQTAVGSALPEALFSLSDVDKIRLGANTAMITQKGNADWRVLGKEIGRLIRETLASGRPAVSPKLVDQLPDKTAEAAIREKAKEIIQAEINPAVASHGGYVELLDVRKNDLFIAMGGGCQGCGMSSITLKHGVEQAFRKGIPNLGTVYDTTDHAAGQNPYYAAGGH